MGTASQIVDRLHQVYRVESDTDLARELAVAKNTVSNWRSRNSKPFSICELVAKQHGVSLDWLVSGVGEMYRTGGQRAAVAEQPRPTWPAVPTGLVGQEKRIETLLELLASLDLESRESILADAIARATTAQQLATLRQAVQDLEAKQRT